MPRGPRDDAPGTIHHVMVRGIERCSIFRDDADRSELLRRLSVLAPELGFLGFAFVLMPNHFHLLVRSGAARISLLMARLGTGYARYFNERHGRVGHLFQNRFRSRRAFGDSDVVGLVLYICRNPLEGGLVREVRLLEDFPWCSVGALTGRRATHAFEDVRATLALFGDDPADARRALRSRLELPVVAAARELERSPQPPTPPPAASFEAIWRQVCAQGGLPDHAPGVARRDARLATARALLAARATRELGLSGAEIARRMGVTRAAVSRMLVRARRHPQGTS